uniref:NADH-ubiquinone oxidoreductase chain 2 n=1 Tax=Parajapyx emeryanus TaxID=165473 RepID=U3KTH6_9HEXA|nr:NADH dehydrogenase subunit 2 [Parajapyx emeryanus]AEV44847.1 NADH dehydrogenase subunit 2 [Parajapyx emeryanus]
MIPKPNKMLFMLTLMSGTIISISSSSWFGAWMGLEINLLSFIPIIMSKTNQRTSEAALKYFIIQAVGSSVLIMASVGLMFKSALINTWLIQSPMILALLLKTGAAPVHFWFPGVMEGMAWMSGILLMTWQKIAPLMLMSYMKIYELFMVSAALSGMVGALGGLNQTLLRKLMAYSSIGHIGWMLSSMTISENFWMTYMLVYSLLSTILGVMFLSFNMFHLGQMFSMMAESFTKKFFFSSNLLSLGGLPPFLGFLPKWMVIQILMKTSVLITITLIMSALLNLFYYLRISFASFILLNQSSKWLTKSPNFNIKSPWETWLTMLSIGGMLFMPLIWPLM